MNLNGWQKKIYEKIYLEFRDNVFSLQEMYKYEVYFKSLYPSNKHIKDKIRQILQQLRDKNILEFIDNDGHYKLIIID